MILHKSLGLAHSRIRSRYSQAATKILPKYQIMSFSTELEKPTISEKLAKIAPGLAASFLVCQTGFFTADILGKLLLTYQGLDLTLPENQNISSPISGIPISIVLGALVANSPILSERMKSKLSPGTSFSTKTILRTGIVCVGIKLSALDLFSTGLVGLPAVFTSVGAGLVFIPWFAKKLNVSSEKDQKMGSLIAAGTSICGITAITALAPAIKASEKDVGFAIANVVAFGTSGMLFYPYLVPYLFDSSHQIGMFLGLAVHDTSQVIGSALTYSTIYGDETALRVATVTKLSRNILLAGVIPYLSYKTNAAADFDASKKTDVERTGREKMIYAFEQTKKYTPGFVLGFIGMSGVRTLGDLAFADVDQWNNLVKVVGGTIGSKLCLGTALAAVGLSTDVSKLKGVGPKPFLVGLAGAGVVGGTGFCSTLLTGYFLL
eukprot:maker-scaffold_8-snap-gene-7.15-mRNA-1 protein AED:0.01 eAED:0.01 QI:86/1/1/1/1/1/4/139/434